MTLASIRWKPWHLYVSRLEIKKWILLLLKVHFLDSRKEMKWRFIILESWDESSSKHPESRFLTSQWTPSWFKLCSGQDGHTSTKRGGFCTRTFCLVRYPEDRNLFKRTFPKKESIGSPVDAMYEQLAFDINFSISFFLSFFLSFFSTSFNESTTVAVRHQSSNLW